MKSSNRDLTLQEVTTTLETTPLNVLMHIKRGLLVGTEEADGWRIPAASLESFISRTGGQKARLIGGHGCGKAGGCGGSCS